jgi:hypothetical protein
MAARSTRRGRRRGREASAARRRGESSSERCASRRSFSHDLSDASSIGQLAIKASCRSRLGTVSSLASDTNTTEVIRIVSGGSDRAIRKISWPESWPPRCPENCRTPGRFANGSDEKQRSARRHGGFRSVVHGVLSSIDNGGLHCGSNAM